MALTDVNLFRIDGTVGSVSNVQTSALNGGPLAGTRNRIINGDMRIDQRNAGASVNTDQAFPVDRFQQNFVGGGVITGQRSTTAPSGFTNSLQLTVSTADASIASTDAYNLQHKVEGFNVADFGSGTASATSFILSFWVRSSITGTYAGAVNNSAANRSYPFTYTINAANTFEFKSVAITADATGTWLSDNGIGFRILWDLGSGSSFNGTAGAWTGSNVFRTSGSVNWIATNGATFYITGVQLEAGTVATPFERRSYGQELALCQRYYEYGGTQLIATGQAGTAFSTTSAFKVTKRAVPTMSFFNTALSNASGIASNTSSIHYANIYTISSSTNTVTLTTDYAASAEL